jgi:hypothetical protein
MEIPKNHSSETVKNSTETLENSSFNKLAIHIESVLEHLPTPIKKLREQGHDAKIDVRLTPEEAKIAADILIQLKLIGSSISSLNNSVAKRQDYMKKVQTRREIENIVKDTERSQE